MIQKIKTLILSASLLFVFAIPALFSVPVMAADKADIGNKVCSGASDLSLTGTTTCATGAPGSTLSDRIATVINIFSVIIGLVAVIMIIVSGFRYITSGGKDESVKGAKNTMLYAIIGLIIVALAQVIVQFVLKKSTGN